MAHQVNDANSLKGGCTMNAKDFERLAALHDAAVKAAQRCDAATPGTVTRRRRQKAWDNAEVRFAQLLRKLTLQLGAGALACILLLQPVFACEDEVPAPPADEQEQSADTDTSDDDAGDASDNPENDPGLNPDTWDDEGKAADLESIGNDALPGDKLQRDRVPNRNGTGRDGGNS